jgi:hypothetical protein
VKVLVCGSRKFTDFKRLSSVLSGYRIGEVIHGGAKGADRLSMEWAVQNGIRVQEFKADWDVYGKRAGPIRNARMLSEGKPDMVVAFLAEDSIGTKDMISKAEKAGVEVKVINI